MKTRVFKSTQDNWCGSYEINGYYKGSEYHMLVEVIFNGNITAYDPNREPVWRTCVWGNDDLGMEYDCATESEAWTMFLQVIGLEFVNIDKLKELGFVSA